MYAKGNTWSDSQSIAASYASSGKADSETWSFSGAASGATEFYIKYDVSGQSYYDPGNNVNHKISAGPKPPVEPPVKPPVASSKPANPPTPPAPTTAPTSAPPSPGPVTPGKLPAILPVDVPDEPLASAPGSCGNFNGGDICTGAGFDMAPSSEKRRWQTPPKGDAAYQESFQDYSDLIGYADIQYNEARDSAVVTVNAASKTGATLTYDFGGKTQSSPIFEVTSALKKSLAITVTSDSDKKLVLEPLNFFWQHESLAAAQSTFTDGQKGGIVELFGWPYSDVAKECEFLGKAGESSYSKH